MSMISEFVEKLIEQIRKKKEYHKDFYEKMGCTEHDKDLHKATQLAFDECMEIVEELSKEYKSDGWIPVSERIPEGKESHKVLVTDEDGIMAVCYFLEVTKKFKVCWDGEEFQGVVAWQPLPEPYKGE